MERTIEWESSIKALFRAEKQVHFVGVGNPIKSDDGVGLFIATELRKKLGSQPKRRVKIHSNSFSPDLLISKVAKEAGSLVIFDAVEHNSHPGSIIFAKLEDTKFGFFATHSLPFKLIPGISANLENIFVLGVQPGNVDIGEGLSDVTLSAANEVVDRLSVLIEGVN
jgi:hydrogenase 3 maturation protease